MGGYVFALCSPAEAGQAKIYRVGVILQGGGVIYTAIDGLREGLKNFDSRRETFPSRNPGCKRRFEGGRGGGKQS